ncbi:hypothetical protein LEP1GSC127_3661 [Leptospira kirschneri str. 200801925]|nr:hypothetical protein LEP1GSC127_3661 [Leptospira kirschneri str. 200801925]
MPSFLTSTHITLKSNEHLVILNSFDLVSKNRNLFVNVGTTTLASPTKIALDRNS